MNNFTNIKANSFYFVSLDDIYYPKDNNSFYHYYISLLYTNKYDYGLVSIIGGSNDYSGSVKLCNMSLAALRSGVGLSRLCVPKSIGNVVISNVFNNIEASARGTASEDDVKGLFDDFTIDNKLGNTVDERNEKLVKLLNAIGDLNFGEYTDSNIDLFGDAYEFLMTMYASSAGKSGGEFFTPPVG